MKLDIQKWNPWNWLKDEGRNSPAQLANDPIWNIHSEIDRMFEDAFSSFGIGRLPRLTQEGSNPLLKPRVDIKETKKNYKITVEVPGVEEKDVKLELVNGLLTLSGEKKYEKEEENEHYHSTERSYGSFRRVLSLPEDANQDEIDAKFKNGVLTITVARKALPKSKEGDIKKIEIKSAS